MFNPTNMASWLVDKHSTGSYGVICHDRSRKSSQKSGCRWILSLLVFETLKEWTNNQVKWHGFIPLELIGRFTIVLYWVYWADRGQAASIIAIFLFSMSKPTWGLDWCLAFSRISFAFTQTQDTQGLLLAACMYQIHKQKDDKGHMFWTCEIIWTWHGFILLNPKEVVPSSSTQQTED